MSQSSIKAFAGRGRTSTFAQTMTNPLTPPASRGLGPHGARSFAVGRSDALPTATRTKTKGAARRRRGLPARRLYPSLALLLLACLLCAPTARAVCGFDDPPPTVNCFRALSGNINVNGEDPDWTGSDFHTDNSQVDGTGTGPGASLRVARKPTGLNKSDLYLFFRVTGDAVAHFEDKIRIALNPGTVAGDSTMIVLHPYGFGNPPEKQFFSLSSGAWGNPQTPGNWFSYAVKPPRPLSQNDPLPPNPNSVWTAEVKISLDQLPHPITGNSFRLYVSLTAVDGGTPGNITYLWPMPDNWAEVDNNNLCTDPTFWRQFTFGSTCFPDLTVPGAPYSCDSIYVLRDGAKSTQIAVNQENQIHADVRNSGPGQATNAQVFLVNLTTGVGTPAVAMNFDHNDPVARQFFRDGFGAWMLPQRSLSTGTPKPPDAIASINAGATNTGWRFRWKPNDEGMSLGVPPSDFVGSHRCIAAFVYFKDDPNFANNFSYCNTSIVNCPTGQVCLMSLSIGNLYPHIGMLGSAEVPVLLNVTALNAPGPDWLSRANFTFEGARRVGENSYEVRTPPRRAVPVRVTVTPPRTGDPRPSNRNSVTHGFAPAAAADPGAGTPAGAPQTGQPVVNTLKNILGEALRRKYAKHPVVYITGYVPVGTEDSGATPRRKLTLYRPIGYTAFVVDTGSTPKCGKATASSFIFTASFVVLGLVLVGRRARRRSRKGTAAPKA